MHMVPSLHSHPFEAFRSFISTLPSTWHTVGNQPPAQAWSVQVMGHSGKDMISTKVVLLRIKWSPLHRLHNKHCDLQVHREFLQDHRKTIQSISQHLRALILHLNLLSVHQGDPWLPSAQQDSSYLRKYTYQIRPGLQTYLDCRWCRMIMMMLIIRAMIRHTWAVQYTNYQSAWRKRNYPLGNLPKGWGRPTIVRSTSGRQYGWLGFWRENISPFSRGRIIWNRFNLDPCTGRWALQSYWRHSRAGCHWIISIMLNEFASSRFRWFQRNVQAKLGRWGKQAGEGTCDRRWIWVSARRKMGTVTSLNC